MAWYLLSSTSNLGKFKNKKEACDKAKELLNDDRKSYHPKKIVPSLYEFTAPRDYKGEYKELVVCTKKSALAEGLEDRLNCKVSI